MATRELSHDEYEVIRNQASLAEVQQPSNDGLLEWAAILRAQHLDPKSPIYANRPDLVANSEMQIAATLRRAGVAEPGAETPLSLAQKQHDQSFSMNSMPSGLATLLDAHLARIPVSEIESRAAALRARTPNYDALVADLPPGLNSAIRADLPALKAYVAAARYEKAKSTTRPR